MKIVCIGVTNNPEEELSLLKSHAEMLGEYKTEVWLPGVPAKIHNIDAILQWLINRWIEIKPDIVFFSTNVVSHELAVRLSARLGCSCYTWVHSLRREGSRSHPTLVGRKKVCSSNIDWEFTINGPAILTLVPHSHTSILPLAASPLPPVDVSVLPPWLISYQVLKPLQINRLQSARLVFLAGRGLKDAASCRRLRMIAARYDAPLGFTRPAALNGWGKVSDIVGQSGIAIKAECCIALGVSGSAAFMAGIDPACRLIAVNIDKNAPIFRYADLGIVARAEDFMAALESKE